MDERGESDPLDTDNAVEIDFEDDDDDDDDHDSER